MTTPPRRSSRLFAILKGRCPHCFQGALSRGFLGLASQCPVCEYKIAQENGYFLGAMMVGFLATSILTIPPVIYLKVSGAPDEWVILYPLVQYLFLAPILTYYSKFIWAHSGYLFGKSMGEDSGRRPPQPPSNS